MEADRNIARLPVVSVALSEIRMSPGPYTVSFAFDPAPLARSIRKIGIVNAPLLLPADKGGYDVVIGYRRLHAVRDLVWNAAPCRILPKDAWPPLDCLLLSLFDNLHTRSFNEVERGMALSRLAAHEDTDRILDRFMPLMGLGSRRQIFEFYVCLDRNLDERIKLQLAAGHLSRDSAKALLALDKTAARAIAGTIEKLKLNINDQRKFIDYIIDLFGNKPEEMVGFLTSGDLGEILANSKLNPPQQAQAALRFLAGRRNPRLAAAEEAFRRRVAALSLPKGTRVEAPPFFEAPGYRLSIPFRDGGELVRALTAVLKLSNLDQLGDPWETE